MKKYIYAAVSLLVVLAAIIFWPGSDSNSNEVDKIRIGYNAQSINSSVLSIANKKGYFQNHGLNVEILPLKGGEEVRLALIAGQIDIGLAGLADIMPLLTGGVPIRIIAPATAAPTYMFVRPGENIKTFQDLYGKTVLVSTGGTNDLIWHAAMSKENIDIKKIKTVDVERAYRVTALMNQRLADAAVVAEQDASALLEAGAVPMEEWEAKGYTHPVSRGSIIVNVDFMNKNEDLMNKFIDGYSDAHRLIKDDPYEAANIVVGQIREVSGGAINHSADVIREQWTGGGLKNVIWEDPVSSMDLVVQGKLTGLIDRDLSMEEIYDLRFEDKLKSLQQEYDTQD